MIRDYCIIRLNMVNGSDATERRAAPRPTYPDYYRLQNKYIGECADFSHYNRIQNKLLPLFRIHMVIDIVSASEVPALHEIPAIAI